MTSFEKKYIKQCLRLISDILGDEKKLEVAIHSYTGGHVKDMRYYLNSTISEASSWSLLDKLKLNAAIFEADAQTSVLLFTEPHLDQAVKKANILLLNKYVPLISKNTESCHRLQSVREHITQIQNELEQEENSYALGANAYTLFSTLAVGGALALAAAAMLSSSDKQNGPKGP